MREGKTRGRTHMERREAESKAITKKETPFTYQRSQQLTASPKTHTPPEHRNRQHRSNPLKPLSGKKSDQSYSSNYPYVHIPPSDLLSQTVFALSCRYSPILLAPRILSPPSVLRSRRVLLPLLLQLRIEEISFPDRRHMIPVPVEIADRRSQTYTHKPNQRSPALFVPVM